MTSCKNYSPEKQGLAHICKKGNMKITLSKAQWEFIGRKTGWIKSAQAQTIEVLDVNETAIPKSIMDREILDETLGQHDFYIYSLPDVEKVLKQKSPYSITIDGMGVEAYMRQKVLKKYHLL